MRVLRLEDRRPLLVLLLILCNVGTSSASQLQDTDILPEFFYNNKHYGGVNGGVLLTLKGRGFSKNMFNFGPGNEHLGNKVVLTSPTEAYDCDIHEDGNTEQLITCYTRPMPPDLYNIQITVDGQLIDDKRICRGKINHWHCTHRTYKHLSPEIIKITPIASRPGGMLKIDGKIFTDLFGSSNSTASNGRVEKIVRVYAGGNKCETKDLENDVNYGTKLTNGDWGYVKCKMQGTFVGSFNVSFIINGPFGRSRVRDEKYFLSRAGKLYQVQTYAEIKSVEPREGSVLGGTLLTIKGKNFDETTAKAKVFVGGRPCVITSKITDDSILCEVDSKPEHMPLIHAGNRGLKIESWDIGAQSFSKLRSFNSTTSGYMEGWNDNGEYSTSTDRKSIRMLGFLVPIYSGRQTLKLNGNGPSQIWLSTNESKEFMRRTENVEIDLIKDKRYYIEVLYENRYAKPTSEVLARMFSKNSSVTQSQTGYSRNMKQRIVLSTTEVNETMIIKLNELNKTESSDDIQSLIIRKNSPQTDGAKFKLKFGKAVTLPLPGTASAKDIQYALDSLPSLTRMVRVVENSTGNTTDFYIFLKLPIGSLPLIEVEHVPDYNGNKLDISLTKMANGKASNRHFAFTLDGVMSSPLSVKATAEQISTALNKMFAVTCPSYISSPPKGTYGYFNDFENPSDYNHNGEAVSDRTPFCGKVSVKNPSVIYYNDKYQLSLEKFPFLCTALHGDADFVMKVNFQYRTNPTVNPTSRTTYIPTHLTYLTEWKYICWDVLDSIKVTGGIMYKLKEIKIERKNNLILLMDAISLKFITDGTIMSELAGATVRQLPPLNPRLAMKQVKVEKLITNVFRITFDVHNCTDKLPTFQTLPKEILPSSQEMLQSSGNVAVEILKNITPGIWTLMKASPPLEGSFRVSFNGEQSENIPIDADNVLVKKMLEAMPSMGALHVIRSGGCSSVTYNLEWITKPGNHELVQVNSSKLTGLNVQKKVYYTQHGGLHIIPLLGDMLMTPHPQPQVVVHINNIPAGLAPGGDATFRWTESATPIVTNVSPSKGALPALLVIEGTGFSEKKDENHVTVSQEVCTVINTSETMVTCRLEKCSYGTHDVFFKVHGKGIARLNGSYVQFTAEAKVLAVAPLQGSDEGGTQITIDGYGFSPDMMVKMEDDYCSDVSIAVDQITCITPSKIGNLAVTPIQVTKANDQISGEFNYTYTKPTADITGINLGSSKVTGGDVLILTGNNLNDPFKLQIGRVPANIMASNSTNVIATLPPQGPGIHDIQLTIGNGFAAISSPIKAIDQTLYVSNVSPRKGSLFGGTRLTITGNGFLVDKDLIHIKVGEDTLCEVEDYSNTWIRCTLQYTGKTHKVTNQGIHSEFGDGYKWEPSKSNVDVGDKVEWSWSVPQWLKRTKFQIQQMSDPFHDKPAPGGFFSGNKTANGGFTHHFTKQGTYYYWGGPLDDVTIVEMRGEINVKPRKQSMKKITVVVSGFEAEYRVNSTDTPASPGNVSCNASDSVIGSCNESPLTSKPDAFYFHFSECSTPVVNSMTPSEGTSKDEITIRGNRLSKVRCENIVKFGQYMCPTIEESDTKIVCKIETKNTYPIGILVPLTLKIENRGFALLDFSDDRQRHFGLLPHIDSISPNKGSTFGGTTISIAGAGFVHEKSSVEVTIGYERCDVKSVSYTYVLCVTPKGTAGQSPPPRLQLLVVNGNRKVPTVCKISKNCTFTYDDSLTPVVTSASPINVTGSGVELTINGNKFGNEPRKIHVETAGVSCKVTTVKNNEIKCSTGDIPAGNFPLHVYKEGIGNLDTNNISLHRHPYLKEINPSSGSFQGGTYITIKGNGFVANDTTVTIHNKNCAIISVSATMIMCETPANSLGIKLLRVVSNGETYPTGSFIYDNANTPNIISISPSNGQAGDTLTLVGVGFSSSNDQNDVRVGDSKCTVFSATSNSLKCTLAHQKTGAYPVKVRVHGKGFSTGQNVFNYDLHLKDFLPSSGSLFGGQRLTITGSGFDPNNTVVTLCSKPCITDKHHVQNTSNYICITPSKNANMTNSCNVSVAVGNSQKTSSNLYTYKESDTAQISSVLPNRGGTRGGTKLTITGSGFSSDPNQNHVTIAGSLCNVSLATTTSVVCRTSQHQSVDSAKVELTVENKGLANHSAAEFTYVDVWSSKATWGNADPPAEGEFLVINEGQKLLLDSDTPVLKMVLIRGGILEFDKKDVELRAENILITDGGRLQIGTEEEPFQHKAIITMYGNLRSKELPIYGAKTLAVRNGTLCLHGRRLLHTWTHLMKTVKSGEKKIVLKHPVPGWRIGDHIVIASTGGRHSQRENEVRTIAAISPDYKELTLNKSLDYEHISTAETIDQRTVEYRAEVGLLTRNIVVRGSENIDWRTKIEACPDGFDTGEFATQTCFQGRFGEEMGSDEFGAQIMLHAPVRDKNLAVAHLSYIEVTFAGQAFRLGRYPIHFHLNGDMSKSYVRGCSVHRSFNRAINVHGSHNTLVEHNVVYDIMGGAIFLEDGIETGNTFQYNLVVFAKPSTSLQNDDITPASFWITNPNNIVRHNAVAGGSHFGFWYRMLKNPGGPSFTSSVCPRNVPLGIFSNNTVHSVGWFGLWTFPVFTPRKGGGCNSWMYETAVFRGLFAWNCEKGAELVDSGAIQMDDFVMVNNEVAGIEVKKIIHGPKYSDAGLMVKNSQIVSRSSVLQSKPTSVAIVFPFGNGMQVTNVTFVNFVNKSSVFKLADIAGVCVSLCGGFLHQTSGLKFINSPNVLDLRWQNELILRDLDGTLTGTPYGQVLPSVDILPPTCQNVPGFSINFPASVCPPGVKFHRFAFNKIYPENMESRDLKLSNIHGNITTPYKFKAATHKEGWMMLLVDGLEHEISFVGADHVTNISYTGTFYQFDTGDHVLITQEKDKVPDRFTLDKVTFIPRSLGMPTYKDNSNGDWFFNTTEKTLTYLISDRARLTRTKRSLSTARDISVNFQAYRCFYLNCEPPKDKQMQPPVPKRPNVFFLWSSLETWKKANEILNLSLQTKIPEENENVTIPTGMWIVVDIDLPKFNTIYIYGQMEVSNKLSEVTISANYIHIVGGRLIVGWENDPYPGNATIELRGSQQTPQFDVKSGPNLGSKVIGVFGGLDMHALKRKVLWTRLASTAKIGTKTLVLEEAVDWKVGEEIVLSSTGYNAWETETFRIDSVSADGTQLTLNATVAHEHIVHQETINQNQIKIAADVGLFTRNIKVIGKDYNNLYKEMFGARIIVGVTQTEQDKVFVGYIRLSNVEFYHSGQYGWATKNDPRYSVALHNLGTIDHRLRPTYVRNCSFHDGFSTAIGIYSSHTVTIDNNIIHHTIGSGIISNSDNTTLLNNLVTLVICPDVYVRGLNFKGGIKWQAGIEAIQVEGLDLRNNIVAGSQRIGYRINGEYCTEVSSWTGNIVRGALLGIAVFDFDVSSKKTECVKYTGFQISRCTDAGIYHNNRPGFIVEKCIFIENSLGVFPFVIGPPSLTHQTSSKEVVIRDSTFVGLTSSYDCSIDRLSKADPNIAYSSLSRSNTDGWTVAIVCPTYTSGSNKAPDKPFFNIMSYPAIDGVMKIHGVTFAHFNSRCVNKMKTVVLKSAPFNEDGQHPVHMHQCRKVDVDTNSLVFIQRPNVNKINSADCVDMDCDGQKKVLILDSDGSFIDSGDSPISVFSVSEWEWGGDKRRGLGDYRIPKEARAYPNGSKMPIEELATGRGIIRNPNCVLRNQWQAYQCNNSEYAMMIIESLDEDTETRRLSPVAIVGNKYIDLINGPQDHGWCSGYTCRKRISTFMAIVDPTYPFDIYFSSITPQKLRLHLLNSDKKISVSVYYQVPNRQDVYDYTNTFILPKSAYMDNGEMKYKTVKESNRKTFLPTTADVVAENFFDRWEQKVYVIVEGGKPVDIRVNPIVVVTFSFGGVSESEFFGENLVRNLALFLGIPASKVRIVDIVKEGAARRKKRAVSGVKVTTEIGDQPSNESNVTNSSVPTNSSLSSQSLQNISSQLVNSRQLKSLDQHLKYQIVSMAMTPPVVPVTDPNWSKTQQTNSTFTVKVPDKLKLVISPKVSYEGGVFNQGPCLQFLDTSGNPLNILGTPENPWRISATLVKGKGSHANAVLSGTTEVSLYDGWANFTNIAISHKGSDYGLTFQVSYPSDAGKFAAKVEPSLIVPKRPLSLMITPSQFVAGKSKNLNIILIDIITKLTIPNIKWRKHKWQVKAVLVKPYLYYGSVYNIDTEVKEDTVNNQLVFNDIMFTKPGVYIIQLTTTSTPDEYTIVAEEEIRVKQSHLLVFSDPVSSSIKILVDIDYNKVGPANEKYFRVLMENYLIYKYPKVTFPEVLVSESENNMMDVFVKLYGNINEVSATSKMICDMAKEQQKITFNSHQAYIIFSIQVNGTRFLGSSCGSKDGKVTKTKTFPLEIVVGVSVAVTLLLAGAIFFLLLKFQVIPK